MLNERRSREVRDNPDQWLLSYAANRHSQCGEDGILEKILDVLGEPVGWCVEFGAWDGRHLSNTCALIESKGFSAVLIEGARDKFEALCESFRENRKVIPVHAFVGFGPDDGLDRLLAATSIPAEFDVLSVDIDGNDYHVWRAAEHYKPRIVVIEYNPTIPTSVEFVQAPDMAVNQGSSLLSLAALGRAKGYELVCVTERNCIFVLDRYYGLFGIKDNSPHSLRPNESLVTWIFCGYDGTVFMRGHGVLPWHGVPYRAGRLQHISRLFRGFPGDFGPVMRLSSRLYRSLKKRRLL